MDTAIMYIHIGNITYTVVYVSIQYNSYLTVLTSNYLEYNIAICVNVRSVLYVYYYYEGSKIM